MITLHRELRDSKIRPRASSVSQRLTQRGEYELSAKRAELTAHDYVQRVKRRADFARSVPHQPTRSRLRSPSRALSHLGDARQRQHQLTWSLLLESLLLESLPLFHIPKLIKN